MARRSAIVTVPCPWIGGRRALMAEPNWRDGDYDLALPDDGPQIQCRPMISCTMLPSSPSHCASAKLRTTMPLRVQAGRPVPFSSRPRPLSASCRCQ